ncbi:MAG: hypothetical protein ACLP7Q_14775 [Isosphaeraceae bacterium]
MTQEMLLLRAIDTTVSKAQETTYEQSSANVNMTQNAHQSTDMHATQDEPLLRGITGLAPDEPFPAHQESFAEEVDRYVRLCEEGQFYDWMMKEFGIPSEERSRFKGRVFKYVMFGRPERCRHSNEWKRFEKAFPQIAKLITEVKREYGYKIVAHLLQRVESSLMINRICRRLMEGHPEIPALTIHDSILTTRKHVKLVRKIIQEEFLRIGLRPTLQEEDYARIPPPMPTRRAEKRSRKTPPAPRNETALAEVCDHVSDDQDSWDLGWAEEEESSRPWSEPSSSGDRPSLPEQASLAAKTRGWAADAT